MANGTTPTPGAPAAPADDLELRLSATRAALSVLGRGEAEVRNQLQVLQQQLEDAERTGRRDLLVSLEARRVALVLELTAAEWMRASVLAAGGTEARRPLTLVQADGAVRL